MDDKIFQLELRYYGDTWVAFGPELMDAGDAVTARMNMIDQALMDNGPEASRYARSHTRVVRICRVTHRFPLEGQ